MIWNLKNPSLLRLGTSYQIWMIASLSFVHLCCPLLSFFAFIKIGSVLIKAAEQIKHIETNMSISLFLIPSDNVSVSLVWSAHRQKKTKNYSDRQIGRAFKGSGRETNRWTSFPSMPLKLLLYSLFNKARTDRQTRETETKKWGKR